MAKTVTKRVDDGAKLLDEKMPGWWRSIRTTRLDMNVGAIDFDEEDGRPIEPDWCGCIGAQLTLTHKRLRYSTWANWSSAMEHLGLDTVGGQRAHGFLGERYADGSKLDALWIEQVRARRKAARTGGGDNG